MSNIRSVIGTIYNVDELGNIFIFDGDRLKTKRRSDGI